MTALTLAFLIFCLGVWYERCRADRLTDARTRRIMAEIERESRRPRAIYTVNRSTVSFCLEGTTYTVPDVQALIDADPRATTGGV